MGIRPLSIPFLFAAVTGSLVPIAPAHAVAQTPAAAAWLASGYESPETPWGHPDLQGNWTNVTLTPFERDDDHEGLTYTPAEAARIEGGEAGNASLHGYHHTLVSLNSFGGSDGT